MRMYLKVIGSDEVEARLSGLPAAYLAVAADAMETIVNLIVGQIHENLDGGMLNRKTGELYDSIQDDVETQDTRVIGRVWSDSPLASIYERGATIPPHEIVVKNARALRFISLTAGEVLFAKRVQHPGAVVEARPFMSTSLEECRAQIREIRNSVAQRVLQ